MTNLIVSWNSHQQMIVTDPGPWMLKDTTAGVLTYCPDCRAYPQPKFGYYAQGEVSCPCHTTRAELIELDPIAEKDQPIAEEDQPIAEEDHYQ
jgi:hypothetical protein